MNYLAFVKQIGWDKLAGAVVRVVAAVVETIVRLVRSRRREAVAPAEGLRVTILSISTETISVETVEALDEDFSWTAKETQRTDGPKTAPTCASSSSTIRHPAAPAQAPVQPTIVDPEPPSAWTSNDTPAGTVTVQVRGQSK